MPWELVWKIVFIGFLATFAIMSVFVTILGARDIRRLLERLRNQQVDSAESIPSGREDGE